MASMCLFTFNNFIGIFLELEPCLINIPFETIGGKGGEPFPSYIYIYSPGECKH